MVQPKLDALKVGHILQYSFAQETVVERVPVPPGTTIRCKVATLDNKKALVLADAWTVGKNTLPVETPLSRIIEDGEKQEVYGEQDDLVITSIPGGFTLYMRVALYIGIGLAIPFLLYQVWAFISPGLYKHEKRYAVPVLTMTGFFFHRRRGLRLLHRVSRRLQLPARFAKLGRVPHCPTPKVTSI